MLRRVPIGFREVQAATNSMRGSGRTPLRNQADVHDVGWFEGPSECLDPAKPQPSRS